MTTETVICTPLTSIENIQKLMSDKNTKEILVVDTILEKHLVGTINEKDILERSKALEVDPTSLNAEQCMRPILAKVRENVSLEECDRILNDKHMNHLVVVDAEGHLCGVYNPTALLPIRQ